MSDRLKSTSQKLRIPLVASNRLAILHLSFYGFSNVTASKVSCLYMNLLMPETFHPIIWVKCPSSAICISACPAPLPPHYNRSFGYFLVRRFFFFFLPVSLNHLQEYQWIAQNSFSVFISLFYIAEVWKLVSVMK